MPDLRFDALLDASEQSADGFVRTHFSVPSMHCGGCMAKIEKGIASLEGVRAVRANLSRRRVSITWDRTRLNADLSQAMTHLGFETNLVKPAPDAARKSSTDRLIPALSLSGCAAGNVMMMSVGVWAGADETMRQVFHTISGVLAFISLAFAGPIFFKPAFYALSRGRSNMDVPISVGLVLTFCVSVAQTLQHAQHAYFDAVTGLIFFLLVGRYLDQIARQKIGSAVDDMRKLIGSHYQLITENNETVSIAAGDIRPGARLRIQPGERVPVDGIVRAGHSDIDVSIITGESQPDLIHCGQSIAAGTLILTSPLIVEATNDTSTSLLADMSALIDEAETGQTRYRQMTDRVADLYTPFVHIAALATFLVWQVFTGETYQSVLVAVSVLIITCPCALALAAPMVQVVASRKLLQSGVLMKDGAALERLASVDQVIFDKTGTLTKGQPTLTNKDAISKSALSVAAKLARHSYHPYAQAIRRAASVSETEIDTDWQIEEIAGAGIQAPDGDGALYRLGRRSWALGEAESPTHKLITTPTNSWTVLTRNGTILAVFSFQDALRHDAKTVVTELVASGLKLKVLSGDDPAAVSQIAQGLGIENYAGGLTPNTKLSAVKALSDTGHHTLMVGDGLNDAPALSAATVSMTPSSAADAGRNKADFVLLGHGLSGVTSAFKIAQRANTLIRQNLSLSILYNLIAVPAAMAGLVTPLVAAIAMSASSLIVVLNALRFQRRPQTDSQPAEIAHA